MSKIEKIQIFALYWILQAQRETLSFNRFGFFLINGSKCKTTKCTINKQERVDYSENINSPLSIMRIITNHLHWTSQNMMDWAALKFVQYSTFGIQHSIFNIQYSIFNIQYSKFNIQHSTFNIQYSKFNIQHSKFKMQIKNSKIHSLPP